MDEWMWRRDGRVDDGVEGWTDGWVEDGWRDRRVDDGMDRWMMDGWMDPNKKEIRVKYKVHKNKLFNPKDKNWFRSTW